MKALYVSLLVALIFPIHSCKKEEIVNPSALLGKWTLYDSYFSIGGSLIYRTITEENEVYLKFDTRGRLSGSDTNYMAYTLKDSTMVTFIKKDGTKESNHYQIVDGLLNLSPAGPAMCIEGCGSRYKKTQ